MYFPFVAVNDFTPNNAGWSSLGRVVSWAPDASGRQFTFNFGGQAVVLQILGPRCFRVRFNPVAPDYDRERSIAVITRDIGLNGLQVNAAQLLPGVLEISTGSLRLKINLSSFELSVFRGNQLIHQDYPGRGILFIPGAEVIAVMKSVPPGASYVGCGEKAGSRLLKNGFTSTFLNFDNYSYSTGPCLGEEGPLNPTEPLYCSIPFLIETNPFPQGSFSGAPYACGIFLDNVAQTFLNIEADDYSTMSGKYYLGALYNELDYYFFAGDTVADVLGQYTTLTGRGSMPPRYAFGFHQGAYGYFDRNKLQGVANAYRQASIPCDGLHIDVDFQDNYRTFTHSEIKFPNCKQFFDDLHAQGFKLSTNVTPIFSDNQLDENGNFAAYLERQALLSGNALLYDTRAGGGPNPVLYEGGVNYGANLGSNPYKDAYPPLFPNRWNKIPLTAPGNYPDLGLANSRKLWGQQYRHLIADLDLDFIWQDMTCPAIDPNRSSQNKSFPGDLTMAQEEVDSTGAVHIQYLPNAKVHNAYALNLLRATWEGINQLRPAQRNFIISRGGYAGMQRYAGLWTGDSASTWNFLRINIPEVLNLGLSGVPISGCDVGGFAKGKVDGLNTTLPDTSLSGPPFAPGTVVTGAIANYELLTRWMQLASFMPWFRNHYDGYLKGFQEPYRYDEPVPTNCRRYVELRYRMLQLYYDAMYVWTKSGMPIARALFLNDGHDPAVYQHLDDQFFIGNDFLIAPILDPHETANPPSPPLRSVYLPSGSDWFAFMDNSAPLAAPVAGGTLIGDYFAGLDRVPIYIRNGAILPFCELEQWVGQLPENPLTINCYPGPDRWTDDLAYTMYQDDGITTKAWTDGEYRVSRVYHRTTTNTGTKRHIRIARVDGKYQPVANFFYLAALGCVTKPREATRDSVVVPDLGSPEALKDSPVDAWYWNESIQIAFAKLFDNRADTTLVFNY